MNHISTVLNLLRKMGPCDALCAAEAGRQFQTAIDEVVLRIGPEFLQRRAVCKDSSRRSETAILKIAGGKSLQLLFVTQLTIEEPSGDIAMFRDDLCSRR